MHTHSFTLTHTHIFTHVWRVLCASDSLLLFFVVFFKEKKRKEKSDSLSILLLLCRTQVTALSAELSAERLLAEEVTGQLAAERAKTIKYEAEVRMVMKQIHSFNTIT